MGKDTARIPFICAKKHDEDGSLTTIEKPEFRANVADSLSAYIFPPVTLARGNLR